MEDGGGVGICEMYDHCRELHSLSATTVAEKKSVARLGTAPNSHQYTYFDGL